MNKLPIDVVQLIGLYTYSTDTYLNLTLVCKNHLPLVTDKAKRFKAIKHFTNIEIDENGSKQWRINGKLHREDGPAIEWADGDKWWYINDKLHRENGPAFEGANGHKAWWINGEQIEPPK